jgi:hypothetical protein
LCSVPQRLQNRQLFARQVNHEQIVPSRVHLQRFKQGPRSNGFNRHFLQGFQPRQKLQQAGRRMKAAGSGQAVTMKNGRPCDAGNGIA